MQKKSEDDRYEAIRRAGLLTTIPVLLAVSPLIGYFMGRFLDGKLGTEPYLGIVFLILGFTAGAMQTARLIRIANRDLDKRKK